MLQSERELEVTRMKLRSLEERYRQRCAEVPADPHARELTLRSLKSLINQFKEEIARFEGRASGRARSTSK